MGLASILFSLILFVQTVVKYLSGTAVEGFTTVILLILIIGGFLMLSLGIIGHYIARIYEEVKGRPKYIVSRRTGEGTVPETKRNPGTISGAGRNTGRGKTEAGLEAEQDTGKAEAGHEAEQDRKANTGLETEQTAGSPVHSGQSREEKR